MMQDHTVENNEVLFTSYTQKTLIPLKVALLEFTTAAKGEMLEMDL